MFVAAGLPSAVAVIMWVQHRHTQRTHRDEVVRWREGVDRSIQAMQTSIESIDKRLDIAHDLAGRIDRLGDRLESTEREHEKRMDSGRDRMGRIEDQLGKLAEGVHSIDGFLRARYGNGRARWPGWLRSQG